VALAIQEHKTNDTVASAQRKSKSESSLTIPICGVRTAAITATQAVSIRVIHEKLVAFFSGQAL